MRCCHDSADEDTATEHDRRHPRAVSGTGRRSRHPIDWPGTAELPVASTELDALLTELVHFVTFSVREHDPVTTPPPMSPVRQRRGVIRGRCMPRSATKTLSTMSCPLMHPSTTTGCCRSHAQVHEAARDFATFSSANGLTVEYDELEKTGMADNPPLVMQDPPTHTRVSPTGVPRIHSPPSRGRRTGRA